MKESKYLLIDKTSKKIICGVRHDVETHEILFGGRKDDLSAAREMFKLLDLTGWVQETDIVIDRAVFRVKVDGDQALWSDFYFRAGRHFEMKPVKTFKRLMG